MSSPVPLAASPEPDDVADSRRLLLIIFSTCVGVVCLVALCLCQWIIRRSDLYYYTFWCRAEPGSCFDPACGSCKALVQPKHASVESQGQRKAPKRAAQVPATIGQEQEMAFRGDDMGTSAEEPHEVPELDSSGAGIVEVVVASPLKFQRARAVEEIDVAVREEPAGDGEEDGEVESHSSQNQSEIQPALGGRQSSHISLVMSDRNPTSPVLDTPLSRGQGGYPVETLEHIRTPQSTTSNPQNHFSSPINKSATH